MKKIVFLTGTRADFGKLKSLILISQASTKFDVHVFATGMHMSSQYGRTVDEIEKSNITSVYKFINHDVIENMDRTLAKTVDGFSMYVKELEPDLIVVHGDRVEALSGAIVGSLNNILVAHIEGGEISGTIDELIRHAVSKMSHIHLVANNQARQRLIQLGEVPESIFIIGSPDLDLMNPKSLPSLDEVQSYYDIKYDSFSLAMFHPVTTEFENIRENAKHFVDALLQSGKNYIVIYPNNDLGSHEILQEYSRLKNHSNFSLFPSLRFEYFLSLLNHADFIIGNSSAGVREAGYYFTPTVDIGTRQANRVVSSNIINCGYSSPEILNAILEVQKLDKTQFQYHEFGNGDSNLKFMKLISESSIWEIPCQKQFQDI